MSFRDTRKSEYTIFCTAALEGFLSQLITQGAREPAFGTSGKAANATVQRVIERNHKGNHRQVESWLLNWTLGTFDPGKIENTELVGPQMEEQWLSTHTVRVHISYSCLQVGFDIPLVSAPASTQPIYELFLCGCTLNIHFRLRGQTLP